MEWQAKLFLSIERQQKRTPCQVVNTPLIMFDRCPESMMGVLHCCANDAMRIMLIGRGYLPNREDYPREALAAALPVLYREQTGHPRKERRLNLLLRLRHGPPPCEPDDVSQAVLDLATRDWWYCAPDDEIEMATNIHDGTNPSVLKQ